MEVHGLSVARSLFDFLDQEALPGSGAHSARFWRGFSDLLHTFGPRNRELLNARRSIQAKINTWHVKHRDGTIDTHEYRTFLRDIGYLAPEGPDFAIDTKTLDPEIALISGPQLIVPVSNARYAINAANARWRSLYDALYGSDALGQPPPPGPYSSSRGKQVITWVRSFLDRIFPLRHSSHTEVSAYRIQNGQLSANINAKNVGLRDPSQFVAYSGSPTAPTSLVLKNNGLHIQIVLDRASPVGAVDSAGVSDVVVESALTTIMDFEDSVAAVDAIDKVHCYRNWLGLVKGELNVQIRRGDASIERSLSEDWQLTAANGNELSLPGRALMMVRTVGHLMTTAAVFDRDGHEAGEGLVDALCAALIARHDLEHTTRFRNSRAGSIYIVKPKMHGPEEVAFANEVFTFVENVLDLAPNTIKIGIMDEERRTTLNLKECIREVKNRIAFINTGFLDRTGDEIHTSMHAGPMVPKEAMKDERWFGAYEDWNVDVGLACGFHQTAQIGKGMWAAPDNMADMLREKVSHPAAGANCAWVPSPTAAALHATHYHEVDVIERQRSLRGRRRASIGDLLEIPIGDPSLWTEDQIDRELENNAQSILGYVVRWVDQGIGCSKVPNIENIPLMEDRATCRISSQHIANWLLHGIVSEEHIMEVLRRMARVVDQQNARDPLYDPMAPDFDGQAFQTARDLIFGATEQPSGYTEPILHSRRRKRKDLS